MGNHLETPDKEPETEFYELEKSTSVVVSKMQGWQKDMCHAHHVAPAVPRREVPPHPDDVSQAALEGYPSWSYLALFGGHGGKEVAEYARRHLHEHVAKQLVKLNIKQDITVADEADVRKALTQAFKALDDEVCENKTFFPPSSPSSSKRALNKTSSPSSAPRSLDERPDVAAAAPAASLGSSALVLLIAPQALVVASVGTSRAVLASEGFLLQLTREHRPTDKDEEKHIRSAHDRPGKPSAPALATRALGDAAFKRGSSSASLGGGASSTGRPAVSNEPDVFVIMRKPEHDEFVLLASDGVANALSNDEACFFLRHALHNNGLTPLSLPDDERDAGAGGAEPGVAAKAAAEPDKKERQKKAREEEKEAGEKGGEKGLSKIAEDLLQKCLERQSRDALTAMLVVFDGAWEPSAHVHISARYVERWTKADVRQYLAAPAIGFEEEAAKLEQHNIDGKELLKLKDGKDSSDGKDRRRRSSSNTTTDGKDIKDLKIVTSVGDLNAMVGRRTKLMGKLEALRSGYIAWDVEEVCRWLRHHRLSDMEHGFRQATIDGPKLARLKDDELRDLFRRRPIAKGKVEKLRRVLANLRVHGEGGDMNFLYASANSGEGQQGDSDAHDGGLANQ